mmetsp:Transcript_14471/g.32272  ORF Transcript_14471/g.32272 Transcript_14471/m.32272 type:complete len:303 (+) Transcript_14471:3770-4678(+)
MLRLVVFERLKKERGSLLDTIARQKGLGGSLDVNERTTLGIHKTLGKVKSTLGVVEHQLTKHRGVIHLESDTAGIRHDLVIFAALDEAVDGLGMALSAEVDTEGHTGIGRHDKITKLLGALELVVLEPLLHQLRTALLKDGLGQLDTLLLVELATFEEGGEVLEDRLRRTGLGRDLLETGNGGRSTESGTGDGNKLRSLNDLPAADQTLKLGGIQILGTGQTQTSGNLDGKVVVAEGGGDVGDEGLSVQLDADNLPGADGNTKDGPSALLSAGNKDRLLSNLGTVHSLTGMDVKHVDITHLA